MCNFTKSQCSAKLSSLVYHNHNKLYDSFMALKRIGRADMSLYDFLLQYLQILGEVAKRHDIMGTFANLWQKVSLKMPGVISQRQHCVLMHQLLLMLGNNVDKTYNVVRYIMHKQYGYRFIPDLEYVYQSYKSANPDFYLQFFACPEGYVNAGYER